MAIGSWLLLLGEGRGEGAGSDKEPTIVHCTTGVDSVDRMGEATGLGVYGGNCSSACPFFGKESIAA